MSEKNGETQTTQQLPTWMLELRKALQQQIKPDDVEQIMAKQIELAKKGDRNAAKFVFDQMGQLASLKGATLVQHNHHYHGDDAEPSKPTKARAGSKSKKDKMAERAARGESVFNEDDYQPEE